MTFKDALDAGYYSVSTSWARGYISRKIDIMQQTVQQNSKGLFVELPCWCSTRYHYRVYITK